MSDAKSQKTKKPINQNLTVPNAMSVFRILVIPFFAYFFLKGNLTAAIVALGLSGLSDALDGMIAPALQPDHGIRQNAGSVSR